MNIECHNTRPNNLKRCVDIYDVFSLQLTLQAAAKVLKMAYVTHLRSLPPESCTGSGIGPRAGLQRICCVCTVSQNDTQLNPGNGLWQPVTIDFKVSALKRKEMFVHLSKGTNLEPVDQLQLEVQQYCEKTGVCPVSTNTAPHLCASPGGKGLPSSGGSNFCRWYSPRVVSWYAPRVVSSGMMGRFFPKSPHEWMSHRKTLIIHHPIWMPCHFFRLTWLKYLCNCDVYMTCVYNTCQCGTMASVLFFYLLCLSFYLVSTKVHKDMNPLTNISVLFNSRTWTLIQTRHPDFTFGELPGQS